VKVAAGEEVTADEEATTVADTMVLAIIAIDLHRAAGAAVGSTITVTGIGTVTTVGTTMTLPRMTTSCRGALGTFCTTIARNQVVNEKTEEGAVDGVAAARTEPNGAMTASKNCKSRHLQNLKR